MFGRAIQEGAVEDPKPIGIKLYKGGERGMEQK